ncbi:hypothetical protein MTR_2g022160 [Medicago truncatula]|uniref:Uncharacterized protein n=1 Tax=Medicago truncatula TaxID=3880 RepID=A0A072V5Y9_MEDTR|nr:hypothetical protein MTR_2g022160 [Medicago truncatula]
MRNNFIDQAHHHQQEQIQWLPSTISLIKHSSIYQKQYRTSTLSRTNSFIQILVFGSKQCTVTTCPGNKSCPKFVPLCGVWLTVVSLHVLVWLRKGSLVKILKERLKASSSEASHQKQDHQKLKFIRRCKT